MAPTPIIGGRMVMRTYIWRPRHDSNAQPADPKSDALSIELRGRSYRRNYTLITAAAYTIRANRSPQTYA
jgi:hypothetical protein